MYRYAVKPSNGEKHRLSHLWQFTENFLVYSKYWEFFTILWLDGGGGRGWRWLLSIVRCTGELSSVARFGTLALHAVVGQVFYRHRHCTAQLCAALHCTALHWHVLHCTALHSYVQHCTAQGLQFTLLFPSVPQIFPAFLKIRFKTREILPNYYWEIRCQNRPCFDL